MAATKAQVAKEAKLIVEEQMAKSNLVLFFRSQCPYSQKALAYLQKTLPGGFLAADLQALSISDPAHYAAILNHLKTNYGGVTTVPQLYLNQRYLGDSAKIVTLTAADLSSRKSI